MLTGSSVSLAWLMTGAGEGDLKSPELVADIVEGMERELGDMKPSGD